MKALDLFCGGGGWSDGLAMEGFQVLGVEIEPKIAKLYNHKVMVADVRTLDGEHFKGYDLIVGSPPCRDFSIFAKRFGSTWKKNPPDPERGLELVKAFIRFVEQAKPRFWIMENVPGLTEYLKINPVFTSCLGPPEKQQMRRSFWGKFPPFLIPIQHNMKVARFRREVKTNKGNVKQNQLERAKIPLPVARALGKAIKEAMA